MRERYAAVLADIRSIEKRFEFLSRRVQSLMLEGKTVSDYEPRIRSLNKDDLPLYIGVDAAKPEHAEGGKKFDQDKPMMALIPAIAAEEEAKVWTFGAKKYGLWNWHKGLSYVRILSGVLRHVFALLRGEDIDPESGLHHAAHARCGLGMLLQLHYEKRTDLDDRMNSNASS